MFGSANDTSRIIYTESDRVNHTNILYTNSINAFRVLFHYKYNMVYLQQLIDLLPMVFHLYSGCQLVRTT